MMRIEKDDLNWAASQGVVNQDQIDPLWLSLTERAKNRTGFNLVYVLYYLGAMIVIVSMGIFMSAVWEVFSKLFGGGGIFIISALYMVAFFGVGSWLWKKDALKTPAGLLITIGVFLTPIATYGFQRWFDIWGFDDPGEYRDFHKWIKGGWFFMEVATIMVGLLALRFYKFPFLTAPIAFTLWYISMDLTPIIFDSKDFSWEERKLVSMYFGLLMLIGCYLTDQRTKKDFAFWGYLFGTIAFWGGLTAMNSDSEISKFIYFLINIILMGLSVFLQRRIFVIAGAIGVLIYLGHLTYKVFENVIIFQFGLILFGIGVLYLGILLSRHGEKVELYLMSKLPNWALKLRPLARKLS